MVETGQGRPDWGFGKAEGEVYIAQHSERSVRLVQSASSSGIHIGIQTTIALHCFGMRKRDSSKCPTNFRMLEIKINEAQSTRRTNLVWHMPAIPSFNQPCSPLRHFRPSVFFLHSLAFTSLPFLGSLPSIHPPSVLVLPSPHPTPICVGEIEGDRHSTRRRENLATARTG